VLVNTDAPGIMPTTLRTEFSLLGEAALDLGYSRTCVEAWLERLREFGLDEFNRNHLPISEDRQ
jgi:biotin operon repressor